MALHNLKIVVVDGGRGGYKSKGSGNSGGKRDKKRDKDSPLYKVLNAKETIKNKIQSGMSPASVFAMDMGLRVSTQVVKQTANYFISDIGRKNGDSNYQAIINRQIEVVGDTMSFGGTMLSGAAAGSMFGPVGAVVGAALGAVSSAASLGFKYAERQREHEHEMFKKNTTQSHLLARANYSIYTGRRT